MNLIEKRCSVCTAPLEIEEAATQVTCAYCATPFAVERRGGDVTLQLSEVIEESATQTRSIILEEADATQAELRRLQLTQEYSHTQLRLANVQREIRAVKRAPQSSVTRSQLTELRAQETDLKAQLATLYRALNPQGESSTPPTPAAAIGPMDWAWLLFSFSGSIGRARFWIGAAIFGSILFVAGQIMGFQAGSSDAWAWLALPGSLLMLLGIWIALAVSIKRLRDRGKQGWWLLILLIPLIGPLWLLVELGIMGAAGDH